MAETAGQPIPNRGTKNQESPKHMNASTCGIHGCMQTFVKSPARTKIKNASKTILQTWNAILFLSSSSGISFDLPFFVFRS